MSDNVVSLKGEALKKEPVIWMCDCGNCSFLIYDSGLLKCAKCESTQEGVTEHYVTIKRWTRKNRYEDKE